MYGSGPNLNIIWFGVNHFATNFVFLNLGPVLAGQIFNLPFDQFYEAHPHLSLIPNQLLCIKLVIVMCFERRLNQNGNLNQGLKKRNLMGSLHGTSAEQTWMLSSPTLTA
ncbi:hypothetical protein DFH28DRAFT_1183742 [Melampsora americana]|nr:hypothetical protein DFH28DRAFT_1183742 [Melampsora americana]